jgi:hypothetical protein
LEEIEPFFLISTRFNIRNGQRVPFWIDACKEERIIQKFDILSTYAQQLDTSMAQALQDAQNQTLVRDIHTLSVQTQQVQLLQYISQEQIYENCQDKIIWNWTTSGQFTVKSFYMAIKEGPHITCKFSAI